MAEGGPPRAASPARGELWVVDWSPGRGSEQLGCRPAVIVQTDAANRNPRYPNTIVGTVSTSGRDVPTHVRIGPDRENGLARASYATCEQVLTSRKFRLEKDISSQLPKVAIISPSSGGIPVAFGVRDALNAEQIYWAEQEKGERMFRQYVNQGEVNPCIIVDDIIRSGNAIEETVDLVKSLGARIIGCGAIVRFESAPSEVEGVPVKSLVDFDVRMYEKDEECIECKAGATPEQVRF